MFVESVLNVIGDLKMVESQKTDNRIKEYETLRAEMSQKISLHNSILTFTITTCVAILSYALSMDNPFLFLLPFCVIIPMSLRIEYYRSALAKLAAYVIVFLEEDMDGIKWETRNLDYVNKNLRDEKNDLKRLLVLQYYECGILAVVSYFFFFAEYLSYAKDRSINVFIALVCIFAPLLLVFWELYITKTINSFNEQRKIYIENWRQIKNSEKTDIFIAKQAENTEADAINNEKPKQSKQNK